MAGKFYAVKKGLKPGIYNSWDECKNQVNGYPGAIYKSFKTYEEASLYISEDKTDIKGGEGKDIWENLEGAIAYVDGSYFEGEYSYGAVIIPDKTNTDDVVKLSGKGTDKEMAAMRNVAGEIEGAKAAMRYATENGIKRINIFHDYQGIASWPLQEWKTNKAGTLAYKKYFEEMRMMTDIRFYKVKGHSGDFYNDMADALAKNELGIEIPPAMAEQLVL